MAPVDDPDVRRAERELREWLVVRAGRGVPELVLVDLLHSQAREIDRRGNVPRAWRASITGNDRP